MNLADLYTRHRQGLFTHALSITGCAAGAEDAVQEAFARLCRGPRWDDTARSGSRADGLLARITDPVAYVFAAVRSAAIDQRRRAHRAGPVTGAKTSLYAADVGSGMSGGASSPSASPEARAIDAEMAAGVAAAVDALPEEAREVLVLRVHGGLSFAQIAAVLDEPVQTVASRYRRALERLRRRLEKLV